MANRAHSNLPKVSPLRPGRKLTLECSYAAYTHTYYQTIDFDSADLGFGPASWVWRGLALLAEKSRVTKVGLQYAKSLQEAIAELASDPVALELMQRPTSRVRAEDIRRLFRQAEAIEASNSVASQRRRSTFRSFVYEHARDLRFAEVVDRQTVRFRARLANARSSPRALISDLHDLSDPKANVPVGATPASSAQNLLKAVKSRAASDLAKLREACIGDMEIGAEIRRRAEASRLLVLSENELATIAEAMLNGNTAKREICASGISNERVLAGVLQVIALDELAEANPAYTYSVPNSDELRQALFLDLPVFRSRRIFEIEHRACVEEIFAAFHLLHTYCGWNWSSVMLLLESDIDLSTPGFVELQSYKSKTDDETPHAPIDLREPGVQQAIDLLRWNRAQLVKLGHVDRDNLILWATRSSSRGKQEEASKFHPQQRLEDLIARHGLPKYSFDQVRTQFLFHQSLARGGIEEARLRGGHASFASTQTYVGNVIQDRLSSAFNLEFSKQLASEVTYLYEGGSRRSKAIKLLRPIGDGASCANPDSPPAGRSSSTGPCEGQACHLDGGCPNRRIVIDDRRVEEVVRFNRHYVSTWQRRWQDNQQRFVTFILPSLTFNAALMLALRNGPYAWRVRQIESAMEPR